MGYIYTKSGKLAKRLYFGAVLLFEGLYYTFKNRVLADGGTFVENELPTISQDASLVLTPNAYKAGKLYSAVPNDGTGDFTVDRDSEATYTGQDGTRETALANVPRIDYSTGEAALLVEPQSTNLLPYSEDFSNASWLIGENSSNTEKTITFGVSYASRTFTSETSIAGTTLTFSCYFDKGEVGKSIRLGFFNGVWDYGVNLLIPANGFVSRTLTLTSDNQFIGIVQANGISNSTISIPLNTGGIQVEVGSTASSYIPTNGTTVTRLADNISVPTPAGVTSITETIDGVEQTPITTIPATYSLPVGNINKVTTL